MPKRALFKFLCAGIPAFFSLLFLANEANADSRLPVSIYATQTERGVWLNELGSSVTVIGEEEIKNSGAVTAADVLRRVPGVNVNQVGGLGSLTQVRIRGSEANHVLLIVDGVKYNDPSGFGFDYSGLLAGTIERIEVVRGPQSGIFGSGAHAGVIAITTKSGKGLKKPIVQANAEAGSFNTLGGSLFAAGGNGNVWGSVSAVGIDTQGYNFSTAGSEKDGANIGSLQVRLGAQPVDGLDIDGNLRYAARGADYDQDNFGDPTNPPLIDTPDNHYNENNVAGRVAATYRAPGSNFEQHAAVDGYSFMRRQVDLFGPFNSEGNRAQALYRASYAFDASENTHHDLSFQISNEWLDYMTTFQPKNKIDITGFAGEWRGSFHNKLFLGAAVRHDVSEFFEDATTYRLTARHNLGEGLSARGAVGTGVTNPTMDELFGSGGGFVGNPNLKPESSFEWEVGLEKNWQDVPVTTGITYFNGVTTNEIRTLFFPVFTAVNDPGESPRQGVELLLSYAPLPNLSFTATYAYTYARTSVGLEEIRRPPHSGSFGVIWDFFEGKGKLDVNVAYNGRMQDDDFRFFPATRVSLDDYLLLNAQLSYQLSDQAQAYIKVQNALDENYQEAFGYRGQPIAAMAGMRLTLGE